MSIITAPVDAQQIFTPPPQPRPAPRLDQIDNEILSMVREHGPVKIWTVLDRVAENQGAHSRSEARNYRLRIWHYWLKRLMWLKLVFPVGRNELVAVKPDPAPARRRQRRRKPSVARSPRVQGGSAINPEAQAQELEMKHPVGTEVFRRTEPTSSASTDSGKSESVTTPAQASEAGRAMAKLRHVPKRPWSGYVGEKRIRRDQKVILADGAEVYTFGTRRGHLVWSLHPGRLVGGLAGEPWQWGVVRAASVKLVKCEPAALLGGLKKGVRERRSSLKQAAARVNGSCPARAGRKRGRPRRSAIGGSKHFECALQ